MTAPTYPPPVRNPDPKDDAVTIHAPGDADPWIEYERKQIVKRVGPLPVPDPTGVEAEVDSIIAAAVPGSIGSTGSTLTAGTSATGTKVISLKSRTMPDRSNGLRGVVLSAVLDNRRAELLARMAKHAAPETDQLAAARARRRGLSAHPAVRALTAATSDTAPPKVTPEQHLQNVIDALAIEVQRADASKPTEDKTALNGALLAGARAVVEAWADAAQA